MSMKKKKISQLSQKQNLENNDGFLIHNTSSNSTEIIDKKNFDNIKRRQFVSGSATSGFFNLKTTLHESAEGRLFMRVMIHRYAQSIPIVLYIQSYLYNGDFWSTSSGVTSIPESFNKTLVSIYKDSSGFVNVKFPKTGMYQSLYVEIYHGYDVDIFETAS